MNDENENLELDVSIRGSNQGPGTPVYIPSP